MNIKFIRDINKREFDIYKLGETPVRKIRPIQKTEELNNIKKREVYKAVKEINKVLEKRQSYAQYNIHEKFGDIMIKIIEKDTERVILEIPPKKVLDLVATLCEEVGIIFDKKA